MCIIVVKPSYQDLPTKDVLEICFKDNDDGAGYSFWDEEDQAWVTDKAYPTFESFWDQYSEDVKAFGLATKAVVYHFRIATSGPRDGSDCHPFPLEITKELTVYKTGIFKSKGIVAHNGVWGTGSDLMSDTQECISTLITPLFESVDIEDRHIPDRLDTLLNTLLKTTNNKWVIAHGDKIDLYGKWIEDNGLYFSNDRYIWENTYEYMKNASKSGSYYSTDDYHYDYGTGSWSWDGGSASSGVWNQNKDNKWYHNSTATTPSTSSFRPEGNRAIIINMPKSKADALTFCDKDGYWEWEKWYNRYEESTNSKTKVDPAKGAVYDEHGDVIWYMDDIDDDEIEDGIWTEEDDGGKDIQCKTCGLSMVEADLNDGECPGCGTLLAPPQTADSNYPHIYDDTAECPVCRQTRCRIGEADIPEVRGVDLYRECDYCTCVFGTVVSGGSIGDPWIIGYRTSAGELILSENDWDVDADAN